MSDDVGQLFSVLKEMAEAEKAEIRAQTEEKIATIGERTEAKVKQFHDETLDKLEGLLSTEAERIVGRAELEMRDRLIHEKNEALREVFELASRQIAELNDAEEYKETFKRLIEEAIAKLNCQDVRLQISRTDMSLWKSLKDGFPESIPVVLCDGPKGTVIVETNDGSRSIDNSIETRLEVAREVMKRELVDLLFDTGA